jgi:hypothetical protein
MLAQIGAVFARPRQSMRRRKWAFGAPRMEDAPMSADMIVGAPPADAFIAVDRSLFSEPIETLDVLPVHGLGCALNSRIPAARSRCIPFEVLHAAAMVAGDCLGFHRASAGWPTTPRSDLRVALWLFVTRPSRASRARRITAQHDCTGGKRGSREAFPGRRPTGIGPSLITRPRTMRAWW